MTIEYKENILYFDDINIFDLASSHATPFYLYSESIIRDNFKSYKDSFGNHNHKICYSVKANSNLSILAALSKLGSGFKIVPNNRFRI